MLLKQTECDALQFLETVTMDLASFFSAWSYGERGPGITLPPGVATIITLWWHLIFFIAIAGLPVM